MIKNILFDIGSVLVQADQAATAREFSFYSGTIPAGEFGLEHVFIPEALARMEKGEITPEQYFEQFLKASGCRITFRHFGIIWAKHFVPLERMIALGRSLSRGFDVYFLSNTNPLHIPVLYSLIPSLLFFRGEALSYELGVLKPDPSFFRKTLAGLGLSAAECLFIDDQAQNVESARGVGLRSIRHLDPESTRAAVLEELGAQAKGLAL